MIKVVYEELDRILADLHVSGSSQPRASDLLELPMSVEHAHQVATVGVFRPPAVDDRKGNGSTKHLFP